MSAERASASTRPVRVAIAVGATLVVLTLSLVYPWIQRGWVWFDASWQYPWFLLLLLIVPVIWWWGTFGQDRRKPRLRVGTITPLLKGPRGARARLRDIPGVLRTVSLSLLILAMARPVAVLRSETGDEKGIDIVLVLDLSGSMVAVLDGDPRLLPGYQPDPRRKRITRLETAKLVIRDFIGRRKTDRIGVVVFGKSAYVLSPPTLDYSLLHQLVSKMTLGVIDPNGTAIGDAVGAAVARQRRSDARSKVIILLTDGDSTAGAISPDYATHLATTVGCKIYTVQIGNGDEVDVEEGSDLYGNPVYRRERFPVNPVLLQKMAKDTGGQAFIATDGKALAESMHAILDSLEKTSFDASISTFEELFHLLLLPGVFLLGIDVLLRAFFLRRFP
jgi:Ca-activated chloride channel family protein